MENKSLDGIKKIESLRAKIKTRQGQAVHCQMDGVLKQRAIEPQARIFVSVKNIISTKTPNGSAVKKTLDFASSKNRKSFQTAKPIQHSDRLLLPAVLKKQPASKKPKIVFPQFQKAIFWTKIQIKSCKGFLKTYRLSALQAKLIWQRLYQEQRVPVMAAVLALFLAFGGGVWAELSTSKTEALDQSQQTGTDNYQIAMPDAKLQIQSDSVSNNVLFNTPIEYLKNYLASVAEPDIIENRKNQLNDFLTEKKSPLALASETIAQQPHWQLILAIAFAESTLGRNCMDNNCSNIGSKPGALNWRVYPSYQSWVVDFNRLLDNKRYKNMTLEQMCGVYVKPCNPNWLAATSQILGELKDKGIN